jgi:hypothetical protein
VINIGKLNLFLPLLDFFEWCDDRFLFLSLKMWYLHLFLLIILSKGWHLKYPHMYLFGSFALLPSNYVTTGCKVYRFFFFLWKILQFTLRNWRHQEIMVRCSFPFKRIVAIVFQRKRCQSIYNGGKGLKMNHRAEGSKRTEGLEWQTWSVDCSTISTFIRFYQGDTVMSLRQWAPYGGQMACYFPSVRSRNVYFTQSILNKVSPYIEILYHTLQKVKGMMMQHKNLKE